jgi:hypothetical protein
MLVSRIGEFYLFQPMAKVTQLYAVTIGRKCDAVFL